MVGCRNLRLVLVNGVEDGSVDGSKDGNEDEHEVKIRMGWG